MRTKSTRFPPCSDIISADSASDIRFGQSHFCLDSRGVPAEHSIVSMRICGFFQAFFGVFDVSCLHFPETRLYYFLIPRFHSARWCNGSTSDSGSFSLGSSPGRAATFLTLSVQLSAFFFAFFRTDYCSGDSGLHFCGG